MPGAGCAEPSQSLDCAVYNTTAGPNSIKRRHPISPPMHRLSVDEHPLSIKHPGHSTRAGSTLSVPSKHLAAWCGIHRSLPCPELWATARDTHSAWSAADFLHTTAGSNTRSLGRFPHDTTRSGGSCSPVGSWETLFPKLLVSVASELQHSCHKSESS